MADELRPIESDETYSYDLQTAVQQARARTAAANYRSESYPSNFEPAHSAPQDDPPPPSEDSDILPNQSNRVNYYDGLSTNHRVTTSNEVTRFGNELSSYATYYNAHIRKQGESNYEIPVSQVQPMNIVDDGAERSNQSNLVNEYDIAASGYSGISVSATSTTGARGSTYEQKMAAANAKFDVLESETNDKGIKKSFAKLKKKYDDTHTKTGTGTTDRSKMSVMEAGNSDIATIKGGMDGMKDSTLYKGTDPNHPGTTSKPAANTVTAFEKSIKDRVNQMPTNVKNGLITIAEYNALKSDMSDYKTLGYSYNRWKRDRRSYHSNKFTDDMLTSCWNSISAA